MFVRSIRVRLAVRELDSRNTRAFVGARETRAEGGGGGSCYVEPSAKNVSMWRGWKARHGLIVFPLVVPCCQEVFAYDRAWESRVPIGAMTEACGEAASEIRTPGAKVGSEKSR